MSNLPLSGVRVVELAGLAPGTHPIILSYQQDTNINRPLRRPPPSRLRRLRAPNRPTLYPLSRPTNPPQNLSPNRPPQRLLPPNSPQPPHQNRHPNRPISTRRPRTSRSLPHGSPPQTKPASNRRANDRVQTRWEIQRYGGP